MKGLPRNINVSCYVLCFVCYLLFSKMPCVIVLCFTALHWIMIYQNNPKYRFNTQSPVSKPMITATDMQGPKGILFCFDARAAMMPIKQDRIRA